MRVGLVADVPKDLVAGGVEHRVQRDGQLAGAEVGAEVPADLPHRVDDVLADLLGELLQLGVGQLAEVARGRLSWEELGHEVRVKMKSVMFSSSAVASGDPSWVETLAISSSAPVAVACDSAASCLARSMPNSLTYVCFP